ncbi:hypothetical protein [Duganella radicis]|nr:hypothetical protein [Duganella radicis]
MQSALPGSTLANRERAIADKYRHLRPVYFPYPGVHAFRKDFVPEGGPGNQATWPGHGLQFAVSMPCAVSGPDIGRYHAALLTEIADQGTRWGGGAAVTQWDFGRTPQLLGDAQVAGLVDGLRRHFDVRPDCRGMYRLAVTRHFSAGRLRNLRCIGFNELSIESGTREDRRRDAQWLARAREAGYRTVQLAIHQPAAYRNEFILARRLQNLVRLAPDRIALRGRWLRKLHLQVLEDGGYRHAGVDLFVRDQNTADLTRLLVSQQRYPQGDCRFAGPNLLAVGAGAINAIGASLSQHARAAADYCWRIETRASPIAGGITLSRDQLLRRMAMQTLLCEFELPTAMMETLFGIDFAGYFAAQAKVLRSMRDDGMLAWEDGWLSLLPAGWPLARSICGVFA